MSQAVLGSQQSIATASTREAAPVVPSDIEIAQAATPIPITRIAASAGILATNWSCTATPRPRSGSRSWIASTEAERQVRRRDRHHAHAAGRRQDDDHRRTEPGAGSPPGQEGLHLHPPAQPGADLRHQGRRGRRRLQPDHPHGGVQPPSDRATSTPSRRPTISWPPPSTPACSTKPTQTRRGALRPPLPGRQGRQPAVLAQSCCAA